MGAEIPVWVGGLQKWVTGLSKKTTCEDIVKALLKAEGRPLVEEKEWHHYVVVERWRKVERPLDSKAKILKVWKAWGEEQGNVKLTLRRLQPVTPKDIKTTRKRHSSKLWSRHHGSASMAARMNTIHPRKLMQQRCESHHSQKGLVDMDGHITETMERLMKVIIAQGETIQAQLRHLRLKEEEIDFFEQQRHAVRVEELGANYLLDTYLGKETSSAISQRTVEEASPALGTSVEEQKLSAASTCLNHVPEASGEPKDFDDIVGDLRQCSGYYERILVLSERLQGEEEMALWLASQIEQHQRHGVEPGAVSESPPPPEEVLAELELVQERVECLAAENVANDAEIQEGDVDLLTVENLLDDKRCYVIRLEHDLEALEKEYGRLRCELERLRESPSVASVPMNAVTTSAAISDKDPSNDTDSNSDTGLSSLHSSSDEGASVLDTLV